MKHRFKPFDRVLVRNADDDNWRCQLYSHPYGKYHATLIGVYVQCISYEGNERLLDTKDSPEPELKKGDVVLVWKKGDIAKCIRIYMHYDDDLNQHMAYAFLLKDGVTIEAQGWDYAQKFVPASVET